MGYPQDPVPAVEAPKPPNPGQAPHLRTPDVQAADAQPADAQPAGIRPADGQGPGVHLTFGADPTTSMVVSWSTPGPVTRPVVRFGRRPDELSHTGVPVSRSYVDARTGTTVHTHHVELAGLVPATEYHYDVAHDGQPQGWGAFRTAPRGRAAFRFTCFGDQGTDHPDDPFGSPASGQAVDGVERLAPLFHLANGDLSYAAERFDPVQAWADWFQMIGRSARLRPWMPCVGNHEIEAGNGALGLAAYQNYFALPSNVDAHPDRPGHGAHDQHLRGLWYAFTVGAARFVMLSADDVCHQDSGRIYLHGFSAGRQTAWLERTLKQARADPGIDWIIVGMHHAAVSTSAHHNGADLGLREEWLPLFDSYEVDLVLCGHEHHYERTHPVRGVVPGSPTRTPRPVPGATTVGPAGPPGPEAAVPPAPGVGTTTIDTSAGTVHLLLGTGGSSSPSAHALLDPPACRVVVGVERPEPGRRRHPGIRVREDAVWLAHRSPDHPYAIAAFDVDPGEPGGSTTIRVTLHDSDPSRSEPFDRFTLVRPRSDRGDRARRSTPDP